MNVQDQRGRASECVRALGARGVGVRVRPRGGPGAPGFSLPLSPRVVPGPPALGPTGSGHPDTPGGSARHGPPTSLQARRPECGPQPPRSAPATYSIMARAILLMVPFTEPVAPRDRLCSVLWAWALFSSRSWDSSMA